MLTLALDTTADFGSIALLRGEEIVEEILLHAPQGFSHVLFPQIEAILARHEVKLAAIDLFAAASGPGSFTGVRVGLSAVKALAEVLQRPAIAVSNLDALASSGTAVLRAALIDARRGEVYAAVYNGGLEVIIPEQVIALPSFLNKLPDRPVQWIATDFAPFRDAISGDLVTAPRAQATSIGRVALRLYDAGNENYPPEAIDANYVRRSDAEILWKEY